MTRRHAALFAVAALVAACGQRAPSLIPPQSASRVALSERHAAAEEAHSRVATSLATTTTRAPAASRRRVRLLRPLKPGVEQWRAVVSSYSWPVETALRVMGCESGGRADAYNKTPVPIRDRNGRVIRYVHAQGLFQVLEGSFDGPTNIRHAFEMWRDSGWGPWRASRPCSGVG